MTESLCSCCKLLGKPSAEINFIISTGLTDSLVHQRIKYLLKYYSETFSLANDVDLTNYRTLMANSDQFFEHQNDSLSVDQSISTVDQKCCHGLTNMSTDINDMSKTSQIHAFQKDILDLLVLKTDSETDEQNTKRQSASWIMVDGSIGLKPALLNVFLQLDNQNSSLLSFSFTALCFLGTEQRLFENWLFHDLPVEDYNSNTYPKYEHEINNFFSLLNSEERLQENTLLINEQDVLTTNELKELLQDIFPTELSKYRATNGKRRDDMKKLLSPRRRHVHHVSDVQQRLRQNCYPLIEDRLKPLLKDLQEPSKAANATRQIARLVLDEFQCIYDEELRIYKRLLTIGSSSNRLDFSNIIAAQLIYYAVHMLQNYDDTLIPLIYSIVLIICKLNIHFIFRRDLINNIPDIYTLSLLLMDQRQYALTLSGIRLCVTILDSDLNEREYARAYLKHDKRAARRVLDAIKWLLSPFLTLKNVWKKENKEKKENDNSKSIPEKPSLCILENLSLRHAVNLPKIALIGGLVCLFYGSTDHCEQVTEDDIHNFAEVMGVLADLYTNHWRRSENIPHASLVLFSDLCYLLTSIFVYSSPSVNLALLNEDHLLTCIPQAVALWLKTTSIDKAMIDRCIRLYTQLIESKCKQPKLNNDPKDGEDVELPDMETAEKSTVLPAPLNLSRDLISSYFNLRRQIQESFASDQKSALHEQIQALLEEEWRKLDIVQLHCNNEQLKQKNKELEDRLSEVKDELKHTQSERDQCREENREMTREIHRLKQVSTTGVTIEPKQAPDHISVASNKQSNINDELKNLSPEIITEDQAKRFIEKLNEQRTAFHDEDMKKSVCGSLKQLGSDLYSSPVHFLHELIQNAEDNYYDKDVTPRLHIEINNSYILLSNNERGLRASDVRAICNLAVTTKTNQQEHIGKKGVGFKSVFAASNQPMLLSRAWKFYFHVQGHDAMSYITPLWLIDQNIPDCISAHISTYSKETHLYLPLKLEAHQPETETFLDQAAMAADPCILLNMRRLKKLEIDDKRQNEVPTIMERHLIDPIEFNQQSSVTFEKFSFIDLKGSKIKLSAGSKDNTFRVYTCYIDIPSSIEQREYPKTRLVMAFPCDKDYRLTSTVYTGLPVCDLGFNFLFNADFQLVTSRENVRENVLLNRFLRDHLAALFVYLLLHDMDLRKDINRYCPSKNTQQLNHSSWWRVMIDDIRRLITNYRSVLFNIATGKDPRHSNADFVSLVSNEQLYDYADIQVIDSNAGFFTAEWLQSFQIRSVSIEDVLDCFPNEDATTLANESRQEFRRWAQKKDEQWWSHFFYHIAQSMTPDLFTKMLQKPIFLLKRGQQRQYLPTSNLLISDDPSFQMWKRQLTLLQYSSELEKTALLDSKRVQILTEELMIEAIRLHHLELANSPRIINADNKLIEEIWKDLSYLKSHLDKVNRSILFLVPVTGTPSLTVLQTATLPTIFGVNICPYLQPRTLSTIRFPYLGDHNHQLIQNLQWEYFLLEMKCQPPSLHLSPDNHVARLPLAAMFNDEKCARLGELVLFAQTYDTKHYLRSFPIVAKSPTGEQINPVLATFDENIVRDVPSLPRIAIPSYARTLAINLGVHVEYDHYACVTILQLLSQEKNTDVDLYIEWLDHLRLYIRQQHGRIDLESLLPSCQLYLPDQKEFYSLNDLLVISSSENDRNSILLVSKYLKLQLISPSNNKIYWKFKDLFCLLKCTCTVTIDHIYNAIYQASLDETNFLLLGDGTTTLTKNGVEEMNALFCYFENLILRCVKKTENTENKDIYHAVVENKHTEAPCGSRDDIEWRFGFTCNSLSQRLKKLTGIQSQQKKIRLPTNDRRLISNETYNIVYACLQTIIIQELSRDFDRRYFILPSIAEKCPLVLAILEIDYVERRVKIEWAHISHNMEHHLSKLTEIFCDALKDSELEVISAKYAHTSFLLSDSSEIDTNVGQNKDEIVRYSLNDKYPFWIFNKTIVLCIEYEKYDRAKASIATSALTVLLHKEKYLPLEEAKSIAREKISACSEFYSKSEASVAGTESSIYSCTDILFPTNYHFSMSATIPMRKHCTIERDSEDNRSTHKVAADRIATDRIYRNRIQTQNRTSQNEKREKGEIETNIVDGEELIRIGHNAEHYFFTQLQKDYGEIDVTPIKNWRSSSRLAVYPEDQEKIDDSAGFDFELDDTLEKFAPWCKTTVRHCYFEIKGINGSYNAEQTRFHVSQNELEKCQDIAFNNVRREKEAYFIVIIENCLDDQNISIAEKINWSENFYTINMIPNSYQCRMETSSLTNVPDSRTEETRDSSDLDSIQFMRSNDRGNGSTARSGQTSGGSSISSRADSSSSWRNREQPSVQSNDRTNFDSTTRSARMGSSSSTFSRADSSFNWRNRNQPPIQSNDRNNLDSTARFVRRGDNSSTSSRADSSSNWRNRDQSPTQSNDRNNNPMAQAAPTIGSNLTSTTYVPPHHQNQRQQDGGFRGSGDKNNHHHHHHHSYKKK